jgi:hypothetical protein
VCPQGQFTPLAKVLAFAILASIRAPHSRGETARFVVGVPPGYAPDAYFDAYILPLSDPADIAHARDLIEFGPGIGEPIAVANFQYTSDGINRNAYELFPTPWSWHVSEFLGFADLTAEILDGSPTAVEEHPEWFPAGIGFWSYTVIAELLPGDFDASFLVDRQDYDLWKDTYGSTVNLGADGNHDGTVNAADYTSWRNRLGMMAPLPPHWFGSAAAAPEPSTLLLATLVGVVTLASPHRYRRRSNLSSPAIAIATRPFPRTAFPLTALQR